MPNTFSIGLELTFVFQAIQSEWLLEELKVRDLMRYPVWGCPVWHQRVAPSTLSVGSTILHWVRDWVLTLGQQRAFQFQVCIWLSCHILLSWAALAEVLGVQLSDSSNESFEFRGAWELISLWISCKYVGVKFLAINSNSKHLTLNVCITFLSVCECPGWECNNLACLH